MTKPTSPQPRDWPIDPVRLPGILEFIQAAEALKDTLRSGFTAGGKHESTAEHSWRLCLVVMLFEKELAGCDLLRLLKLCIIHDLGEAISGDVPAIHQSGDPDRAARERRDLVTLCAPLPSEVKDELIALWDEYSAGETREAVYAKGFDKIETMLQHIAGDNPPGFDYGFNLSYGLNWTNRDPLLAQIREAVDEQTRALRDAQNDQT